MEEESEECKQSCLSSVTIKIGDKVVLEETDELARFDLDIEVKLLVGLTLLKLGIATSLAQMNEIAEDYTFLVVDGGKDGIDGQRQASK